MFVSCAYDSQVNCIEMSTNSGTVRKQVRETLKQLQKDKRVVKHLLEDLDLNCGVHMVMALPNITSQLLKQKLDASFVQVTFCCCSFCCCCCFRSLT